ncbi:CoA-acylating methylmalonate-semialdehyde dehydrogenase [Polyangium jinanense]|uniref:methylmalonate-semialdehyde dehydrogenase (CoA acylating) n=1 Tax=Polyangium jinanense TaxID=2829994 RepID=A0A9X3WW19_9BACT|nr:CoA-acylating methylmalonate-semialdehyde dehydrogenase [Polyangium jinanense]MDC3953635.1 CoA-acylating methylmalonate-semialdehyde dehydrogenase [Polyangium jinanense]MDC3979244.1 CoA-acylating methylmalonate-semialdehyde dehydrogenase [Polyangium jinanense]
MRVLENFINGAWVASAGTTLLDVKNPATGEVLAKVPLSTSADVDAAVQAAKAAFPAWRAVPPVQRARYLFKLKSLFDQHREEIANICTSEHGKTFAESFNDFGRGIENVEHACGTPSLLMGQNLEDVASGIDSKVLRQPLGVFAAITPFNFPPMVPLWFLPYAIATGNTFVLKPSEQVPLSQRRIFELIQQIGLPNGVVNLVNGGREVVEAICEHPDVKGVSFVGSSNVAKIVYRKCGETGKRVQALGGAKNFIVIMPDADMERAVQNAVESCYGCAGQRCLAGSVIVPVGDAYERVRDLFVAYAKKIVLGDGKDPATTLGPVISRAHKDRVLSYIEKGLQEGAKLVLDGRNATVPGLPDGNWIGPTIFEDVRPDMVIGREEIFGPVASFMRAKDLDEAIRLANASEFGNAASIYTTNGKAAREFGARVEAGMVGVNIGVAAPMSFFPFGGQKASLFGDTKAHGSAGIDFYTERKIVIERWF